MVEVVKVARTNLTEFFFRDRKCVSSGLVQVSKVRIFSYINGYGFLLFRLGYTKDSKSATALPGQQAANNEYNPTLARSPRRSHLCDVGDRTIATGAHKYAILFFFL